MFLWVIWAPLGGSAAPCDVGSGASHPWLGWAEGSNVAHDMAGS